MTVLLVLLQIRLLCLGESLITGLFNLVKSANKGQTSVSCDLVSRPSLCSTKGIPTELNSMLV